MKTTTKLIYIKQFVNNVRVETVKSSVNNNSHLNLFKNFSALSKKKGHFIFDKNDTLYHSSSVMFFQQRKLELVFGFLGDWLISKVF